MSLITSTAGARARSGNATKVGIAPPSTLIASSSVRTLGGVVPSGTSGWHMSRGLYPLRAGGELLERVTGRRDQTLARAERPGDFRDVEVAIRVEGQTVWRAKVPWTTRIGRAPGLVDRTIVAEPCQDGAAVVEDRHTTRQVSGDRSVAEGPQTLTPGQLGDDRDAALVENQLRRSLHVGPLGQELSVRAENLDAVVLPIAYEYAAVGVHRHAVRDHELAGAVARFTPRAPQLAIRRELVHARVPVTIGDVEVT